MHMGVNGKSDQTKTIDLVLFCSAFFLPPRVPHLRKEAHEGQQNSL
jgi:hypothetical protein